jgi:hypothetical protein
MRRAAVLLLLVAACRTPASQPPAPAPAPAPQAGDCGTRPGDWCPAPKGDPCGEHKELTSCRADPRCGGMAYMGESVIACKLDARGFAENCPTVGCISLPRH